MATTMKTMALIVAFFGVLSFVFGVVAENKKGSGIPIAKAGVVVCKYQSEPTVVLGYLSVIFLAASTAVGIISLGYPYEGKAVPRAALFQNGTFAVFSTIALFTAGLAAVLLLWPTVSEHLSITNNVHRGLTSECPGAKTGLIGGGAFVALDASLLWLVALMLTSNARQDFFEEAEKDPKGEYGLVVNPGGAY